MARLWVVRLMHRDPARPRMTSVHWVLYDLPASSTALAEAVDAAKLPPGTKPGLNDWKKLGYGGPCPPTGKHRYFHKLYSLDVPLPSLRAPDQSCSRSGNERPYSR